MLKYIIICVIACIPYFASGQVIKGKVTNTNKEALLSASVYWSGTTQGVSTDEEGRFSIKKTAQTNKLIISYIGYYSDTVTVNSNEFISVVLKDKTEMDEVVVKAEYDNIYISELNPIKTESITTGELKKAACCDLAGCFGTQSTVQAKTTNVITNSKELRILGLSGVYNQVLIDGLPMIHGLSYTYGISSYPGTIVQNIFVSKGTNSVLQGFESISGQINVVTKSAESAEKVFLNAYINSFAEKQVNAHYAGKKGEWNNLIAIHTTQPGNKHDRDKDDFLDMPLLTRYSVFDKLKYGSLEQFGFHSETNFRFVNEKRIGGQSFFDPDLDKGTTNAYGQTVNFTQVDIGGRTGYKVNDDNEISLYYSAFYQDQESYFGTTKYDANQTNLYFKLQYDYNYGSAHNFKAGASYRQVMLDESISFTNPSSTRNFAGDYVKEEYIPGIFLENTLMFFNSKLSWMVGMRADHHNKFGFEWSPRTLIKYTPVENFTLRANLGTGWRTVNIFSENINLLVSSRDIIIPNDLKPEEALNYGLNATLKFNRPNFSGFITADVYRTEFQNQIFPDYYTSTTEVTIDNFDGESVSNGFQLDVVANLYKQFEVKAGYSYLDVYRMINNEKVVLPFNAKDRFHAGASYTTKNEKLQFDVNMRWIGEQRLPNTSSNPVEYQRPDMSESYALVNSQVSYNFKNLEIYLGCENIFDSRQEKPIIGWDDPFGQYFDTSSVWGQTKGREFYLGVRFFIK